MRDDSPIDLPALLAKIRGQAVALANDAWPDLSLLADDALPEPLEPFALAPICTGMACGAQPETLSPIAAVIVLAALALRIIDDCADEDNPGALYLHTGKARAANAAAALTAVAVRGLRQTSLPVSKQTLLLDAFLDAFIQVCRGQDQDMGADVRTLAGYRTLVRAKTVAAFEFAAAAGAYTAGVSAPAIARAADCGAQLGWMLQLLDDIEAFWFSDHPAGPERERWTFPVLLGLETGHAATPRLGELCMKADFDIEQARALLDAMGVRRQLVALALDHRDRALATLGPPLQPEGRAILQLWLDWNFRDGARLLGAMS